MVSDCLEPRYYNSAESANELKINRYFKKGPSNQKFQVHPLTRGWLGFFLLIQNIWDLLQR